MITVVAGDILVASADAIVLPVDGTFVPRAGRFDRLLGAIGAQFVRRFPEAELLEEIEAQVDLPLGLGQAAAVELAEGPFRVALLACTLHHAQTLDDAARRAVVARAFAAVLRASAGVARVAAPVLQGGWRLEHVAAFREMVAAYRAADRPPDVDVHCIDPGLAKELAAVVRSAA